jgi:glycosyltransferase involved in cell wall biosynthesis
LGIPDPKIRILHNEVNTEKFKPTKEAKIPNLLLFVGRLQPQKGLHVLLKSLEHLRTPVRLAIIGPLSSYFPDYKNEITKLVEKVNQRNIHHVDYLGVQDTNSLVKWYQKAAIFVCPSLSEPFGIVNLEALSCGTPVIASNVGGIPEAVQDNRNSILVKPNNPTNLADAIQFLLDNEKVRKEFGENGRKWVVEHFSQEALAEKVLETYTELLTSYKQPL